MKPVPLILKGSLPEQMEEEDQDETGGPRFMVFECYCYRTTRACLLVACVCQCSVEICAACSASLAFQ